MDTKTAPVALGDRTYAYVDPGEFVEVEMPLKDALLSPPTARKTVKVVGEITEEGGVRLEDGRILPMPSTYRLRRPR